MSASSLALTFQSTRPRGARHAPAPCLAVIFVSIHAPARGATASPSFARFLFRFNPRARAGRDSRYQPHAVLGRFQSTRPRGARHAENATSGVGVVSIHAPARGATSVGPGPFYPASFNPRARAGRDIRLSWIAACRSFQSTRPRGARLADEVTSPEAIVSIHAPARGATWIN